VATAGGWKRSECEGRPIGTPRGQRGCCRERLRPRLGACRTGRTRSRAGPCLGNFGTWGGGIYRRRSAGAWATPAPRGDGLWLAMPGAARRRDVTRDRSAEYGHDVGGARHAGARRAPALLANRPETLCRSMSGTTAVSERNSLILRRRAIPARVAKKIASSVIHI